MRLSGFRASIVLIRLETHGIPSTLMLIESKGDFDLSNPAQGHMGLGSCDLAVVYG